MLQKIFTKYWLVVNIGLTILVSWVVLPSSIKASSFLPVLWMGVISAEFFILLPTVFRGETLAAARLRAVKTLTWDSFLYAGLFLVLFLFVQWVNGGCVPEYDSAANVWGFSAPNVKWLPYSINTIDSFRIFNLFAAILLVGLCMRNAVGKKAKRFLLQWLCSLSGLFAVYAITKGFLQIDPYMTYMEQPEMTSYGTFFGFWMVVAVGAYADALSSRQRRTELLYLLGIVSNFAGMLCFASLTGVLLYVILAVLLFVYLGAYLSFHVPPHVLVKMYLVSIIALVAFFGLSLWLFPEGAVAVKLRMVMDLGDYWKSLLSSKAVRSASAMKIWESHMWFGTGANGFEHYLGTVIGDTGWSNIQINKGFVYNDALQVLCEFGLLGSALLAAFTITLMVPICYRAHIAWTKDTDDLNAGRKYLLRVSPVVVAGVIATLCCFGESFVSSPFRMPAMFMSFFIVMLAMPAFLPSPRR